MSPRRQLVIGLILIAAAGPAGWALGAIYGWWFV